MAAVRELTTKFTFTTDETGLKKYQTDLRDALKKVKQDIADLSKGVTAGVTKASTDAVDKVKNTFRNLTGGIGFIGKLMGTELAISTVAGFVSGVATNVRAANKLGKQMEAALSPDTDTPAVMDHLFDVAQDLGAEFVSVASTFKDMASAARLFGVDTETAMGAFENISKAMEVNRLSDEDTAAAWGRINTAIGRGALSARSLGELMQEAPKAVQLLADSLTKGSIPALQELAKDGKITSDIMVKGFSRVNKELDKAFAEKPDTLGEAFNYAYNWAVKAGLAIWKITFHSRTLAATIRWLTDAIVSAVTKTIDSLGGLENVLELIQLAFIAAFGYYSLSLIISIIAAVQKLGFVAAIAQLKFAAIGLAIGAAILLIQDLMGWLRGDKSYIGSLIGRRDKWEKEIENIKKPFESIGKIFEGDLTGGLSGLLKSLETLEGFITTTLLVTIGLVLPAFKLWNFFEWTGLNSILRAIIAQIFEVKVAAETAETALGKMGDIPVPKTGLLGMLAKIAAVGLGVYLGLSVGKKGGAFGDLNSGEQETLKKFDTAPQEEKNKELVPWTTYPEAPKEPIPVDPNSNEQEVSFFKELMKKTALYSTPGVGQVILAQDVGNTIIDALGLDSFRRTPSVTSGDLPISPPGEPPKIQIEEPGWFQKGMTFIGEAIFGKAAQAGTVDQSSIVPRVDQSSLTPGAMTTNNTQTNNVPIANNVNVTVSAEFDGLESRVLAKVNEATTRIAAETNRQIVRSFPRMEMEAGAS